MRKLNRVLVACSLAAAALAADAAELVAQENNDRGVTIAVTPQALSKNAEWWDFRIVLDTHSADLDDDLAKTAVLLAEPAVRQLPVAWEGAGPGGHHREGVLRFKSIAPMPQAIELRIQRAGEPAPRSFRWQLE